MRIKWLLLLPLSFFACLLFKPSVKGSTYNEERVIELMARAKEFFDAGEYKEAIRHLETLIEKYQESTYYDDALYLLGVSNYRLENYVEAIRYSDRLNSELPNSPFYVKSLAVLGEANYALKNYYEAAVVFVKLYDLSKDKIEREKANEKVLMILPELKINELEKLHRVSMTSPLDEHILFYLGEREIKAGKIDQGRRDLELLNMRFPTSQYERQVEELLASSMVGKITRTMGILLPLSGRFAQYGNAIKGLLDYYIVQDKYPFPIKYLDTKSEPIEALRAGLKLSQDYRVDVIVGPVFTLEAFGICGMASGYKTPILLPTISDPRFENTAPSIIQINTSGASEAKAIARYAVEEMGLKQFGIFFPNDGNGEILAQTFEEEVRNRKGEIVGRVGFRTDTTTFGKEIETLKKTNPEAVFFPGDGDQIILIAPQFAYYGLEKVRLLGIRAFNEEKIVRLGEKYVEGAIFAVQESPQNDEVDHIIAGYEKQHNKKVGFAEKKFLEAVYGLKKALATEYSRNTIVNTIQKVFKKDEEIIKIFTIKENKIVEVPRDSTR